MNSTLIIKQSLAKGLRIRLTYALYLSNMYKFTFYLRAILLSLLFVGAITLNSAAQSEMRASNYYNLPTYNTLDPDQAVDNSLETAATLTPLVIGGSALRVGFGGASVQQGQQAKLIIKAASGLLNVSALGRMRIRTFLSSRPNQPVQDVPLTDPSISVGLLLNSTANAVTFTAAQPFDQLELQSEALASISSNVSVYAVFATVAPLPVQLTSFIGKTTSTGVALTWETASEQHNDHFVVERADNSPDSFQALSLVKGAGTSARSHQYQYVDATPGGLRYYRLRQVDTDGKESFSPVVAVKAELTALVAYPSIATETLTIAGTSNSHLGIFDQMGQQVQIADLAATQSPQVDVRGLPSGVYFLRDAATGQSTRFIKSNGH
jgi:hypothetical protein